MSRQTVLDKLSQTRSPYTELFLLTQKQFDTWTTGLAKISPNLDLSNTISIWNLLAGIFVITEEESERLLASEAYYLTGLSEREGRRKVKIADDFGLIQMTVNKSDKKQKFVTLSVPASRLVRDTMDQWSVEYERICPRVACYRERRKAKL